MIRHASLVLAVGVIVFAPHVAHAGVQNIPCKTPFVFTGAAVNVVVLPYEAAQVLPRHPRKKREQREETGDVQGNVKARGARPRELEQREQNTPAVERRDSAMTTPLTRAHCSTGTRTTSRPAFRT